MRKAWSSQGPLWTLSPVCAPFFLSCMIQAKARIAVRPVFPEPERLLQKYGARMFWHFARAVMPMPFHFSVLRDKRSR